MDKSTTKQTTKMVAVTITAKGRKMQAFIDAPVINGKSVVSVDAMNQMMRNAGILTFRGDTISIG